MQWKPDNFNILHFRNASFNHLHALVKNTIFHRKHLWQVGSEWGVVIRLLLPKLSLVQVPISSLRLIGCLSFALQNLQHKLISARISIHTNPKYFYIHPKLKTLTSEIFFLRKKIFDVSVFNFGCMKKASLKSIVFNNSTNLNSPRTE